MTRKIYGRCGKCAGTGICQPCKGSGCSGFFLTLPKESKPCPWCQGSASCDLCGGSGRTVEFEPYIYIEETNVQHSPIHTIWYALTGGTFKYIRIPDDALSLGDEELLAWASATVREHYRKQNGKGSFGDIAGYRFVKAPNERVRLDAEGRLVEAEQQEFAPDKAVLQVGNKVIEVKDGSVRIEPSSNVTELPKEQEAGGSDAREPKE